MGHVGGRGLFRLSVDERPVELGDLFYLYHLAVRHRMALLPIHFSRPIGLDFRDRTFLRFGCIDDDASAVVNFFRLALTGAQHTFTFEHKKARSIPCRAL